MTLLLAQLLLRLHGAHLADGCVLHPPGYWGCQLEYVGYHGAGPISGGTGTACAFVTFRVIRGDKTFWVFPVDFEVVP